MSEQWTFSDREALRKGLEEALETTIENSSAMQTTMIARSRNTTVLRVVLAKPYRHNTAMVVKWFRDEPKREGEPVHELFNRLDVLYNSEERNLKLLRETVDPERVIIPEVYGMSHSQRLVVMQPIGRKTRKNKLLKTARKYKFKGDTEDIPTPLVNMFTGAIDLISTLVGTCNAKANEFQKLYNYEQDATYREERWADIYEERLTRLFHRKSPKKNLPIGNLNQKLHQIHEEYAGLFREPQGFYHGDFNFLQVIGNKIIDFELFGKHGYAKDLATLVTITGIRNSTGVLTSKTFEFLADRYLVGVDLASQEGTIKKSQKALNRLQEITPSELHDTAITVAGDEGKYAGFVASVYYHSLCELVRLGAAYDRMEQHKLVVSGDQERIGYTSIIDGIYRGIDNLFSKILANPSVLDSCTNKKEKKEFFREYRELLVDLGLLGKGI